MDPYFMVARQRGIPISLTTNVHPRGTSRSGDYDVITIRGTRCVRMLRGSIASLRLLTTSH